MTNRTYYEGQNEEGRSPQLWRQCRWDQLRNDRNRGVAFWHDLDRTLVTGHDFTILAADAGSSQAMVATERYGVWAGTTGATLNNEVAFGGALTLCQIGQGDGKVWFETRIKQDQVANGSIFVGLVLTGQAAAANTINDGGTAFLDQSYVAFRTLQASPTRIDFGYNTTGGGTTGTVQTGLGTLVAATYIKLGFFFDGAKTLQPFINNVPVGTAIDVTTSGFPDDVNLVPDFYIKATAATSTVLSVDWVAVAHEYP